MKMTYPQYITNPMGNRVMSNREIYRKLYTEKLDKLIVRENGNLPYYLFQDTNNKRFIAVIKTPSESVKHFFYDVVVEFTTTSDAISGSTTLRDYHVRFYSNEPAFIYTFCYAFIHNGLFFTDLEDKMSKMAKEQKANTTNAKNEIGYCKSLYFAYLIMEMKNLFDKRVWSGQARSYDKHILHSLVEHTSAKAISRQQMLADQRKDVKKFETAKKIQPKEVAKTKFNDAIGVVRTTPTVSKTPHSKRL